MPPTWLVVVSWCALAVAAVSAAAILYDIHGRGYRQHMRVMEAVWPVTALYAGPLANLAYRRWGRPRTSRWMRKHDTDEPPEKPGWATTAVGVSHCGAGCTLGDILAATVIFLLGLELAGETLFAEYVGDYVAAVSLGLLFQYFAIAPMRGLGVRKGIVAAAKADILSLTAFEVGMFAWMAVTALVLFPAPHHVRPDSPVYWFMMQVGMLLGFLTACPVNAWLIRRGVKEAM